MKQPATPYSATIWDERETGSRDRIETFQLDALRRRLRRVGERSRHYRRHLMTGQLIRMDGAAHPGPGFHMLA
jgi:hypothetical protein